MPKQLSLDPTLDPREQLQAIAQQGGRFLSADAACQMRRAMDSAVSAERFARAVSDALDVHLAVLNAQGDIVAVNTAWQAFARGNGLDPVNVGIGVNYLAVCDAAKGEGEQEAQAAVAGLRALLAGERCRFELEYPCHSPRSSDGSFCGRAPSSTTG